MLKVAVGHIGFRVELFYCKAGKQPFEAGTALSLIKSFVAAFDAAIARFEIIRRISVSGKQGTYHFLTLNVSVFDLLKVFLKITFVFQYKL